MLRHIFALIILALVAGVIYWNGWGQGSTAPVLTVEQFVQQHWQKPLVPQGQPPKHFSALEASLSPKSCAKCHSAQFNDWQSSLHSKTLGPGILWQLHLMNQTEANACLDCHAPLAEQKALLAKQFNWPNAPQSPVPGYVDSHLADDGLVCAACHVRQHQRFGPVASNRAKNEPHNGFIEHSAYSDSAFCATCHQFPADGPRTAGKLRENTYQEWLASPYAQQGVHCQICHMPERKHQWRGIHDASMTRAAVSGNLWIDGEQIRASLTNSGAGHLFPTYMVPKITVQLVAIPKISGTATVVAKTVIGWQVSEDLLKEDFDTRLAPQETLELSAPYQTNTDYELRLWVEPDEHYQRTFKNSLQYADQIDEAALYLLQQAIQKTESSAYELVVGMKAAEAAKH